MSPPRRTRRCAWPWCAWSDLPRERDADGRHESGEWRERHRPRTPTRPCDGHGARRLVTLTGVSGRATGGRLKTTRIKRSSLFARRATLLQSSATGLPPASRIGRVEARHRCPPHPARSACATSIKRKERPCCACNGLVVKLSNDSPELRSLPPRKQRTLFANRFTVKRDVTDTCTFQVSKAATSALVSGLSERLEL